MTDERLRLWLGFWKWFLSTVVITGGIAITTTILNAQATKTELQIQTNREEKEYLTSFIDRAIEDNLEKRHRFALYFASVSSSDSYKQGWKDYLNAVSAELKATQAEATQLRSGIDLKKGAELEVARARLRQLEAQLEARIVAVEPPQRFPYFDLSNAEPLLNAEIACPSGATPAIWNESIRHIRGIKVEGHQIARGCHDSDGRKVGPYIAWYEGGRVKQSGVYGKDDQEHTITTYHETGQKAAEWKERRNSILPGTSRYWDVDGREQ